MSAAGKLVPVWIVVVALVSGCVAAGAPATEPGPVTPHATPAIGGQPTPAPTPEELSADQFWASLFDGDPDFAAYPSLESLAGDATAVVVAAITSVDEGPSFTDEYKNVQFRAVASLDVQEVLVGKVNALVPGTTSVLITLGVQFAGHEPDPWQARLASLKASLPHERAILFLIDEATFWSLGKAPTPATAPDPMHYLVFASNGFIRDDNGVARPSTLTETAWTNAIDGQPFDDVVAEVAAMKPAD